MSLLFNINMIKLTAMILAFGGLAIAFQNCTEPFQARMPETRALSSDSLCVDGFCEAFDEISLDESSSFQANHRSDSQQDIYQFIETDRQTSNEQDVNRQGNTTQSNNNTANTSTARIGDAIRERSDDRSRLWDIKPGIDYQVHMENINQLNDLSRANLYMVRFTGNEGEAISTWFSQSEGEFPVVAWKECQDYLNRPGFNRGLADRYLCIYDGVPIAYKGNISQDLASWCARSDSAHRRGTSRRDCMMLVDDGGRNQVIENFIPALRQLEPEDVEAVEEILAQYHEYKQTQNNQGNTNQDNNMENGTEENPINQKIRNFVKSLYVSILGRSIANIDDQGLNHFYNELVMRPGVSSCHIVIRDFYRSREHQERNLDNLSYVKSLYLSTLGRNADDQGLNHHANTLSNGLSRDQLLNIFLQSDESRQRCLNVFN